MTPPGSQIRRALEDREAEQQMAGDRTMARTRVEARVNVRGSGESRAVITFPVVFNRKPMFTFGGELTGGSTPEAGAYPVISVMVLEWKLRPRGDDRDYYIGCEVGIVALGKERQRVTAHCVFEGMAFRARSANGGGL